MERLSINDIDFKENTHNYGADLLRIVAMLLIVAHHFSLHSGITCAANSFERTIMSIMALGGKTGVNIFVLITGYFSSGKIRREKIGSLFGCTTLYSLLLTILAVLLGEVAFSKKILLKASLPLFFGNTYWFIVTYLELYILTPILNIVIQKMDERVCRRYLLLFTCLLCVFPTFVARFIQVNDFGFITLVWFVYLYYLGAYLKKYAFLARLSKRICIIALILAATVQIAACVLLQRGFASGILQLLLECLADYNINAVSPLLISVCMLMVFLQLKVSKGRKFVQLLGASTLGVYLFHDNTYFRKWMWQTAYQLATNIGLDVFVLTVVLSIALVFALGCTVEILRKTVAKHLFALLKKIRK